MLSLVLPLAVAAVIAAGGIVAAPWLGLAPLEGARQILGVAGLGLMFYGVFPRARTGPAAPMRTDLPVWGRVAAQYEEVLFALQADRRPRPREPILYGLVCWGVAAVLYLVGGR